MQMGLFMAALAAVINVGLVLILPAAVVVVVESATDSSDVEALGVLYSSLHSPWQLTGWSSGGGDPCGNSWKGISCSGSAVTAVQLSGLGLNGTMGYLLSHLLSLKTLDLSSNYIHEAIPYQLPPNLTYLNLAKNNFSGGLPYSISDMVSLNYINFSHNILSQSIGDVFYNLQNLSELDLSFNNLTGDLPCSFRSLSSLSTLYLQNNRLTGSVNFLANLDLTTLNIAHNHFSGWIPQDFSSILNLVIGGNSFSTRPAPPPPPYMSPPPGRQHRSSSGTEEPSEMLPGSEGKSSPPDGNNKKSSTTSLLLGIVIGSTIGGVCVMLVVVVFCLRNVQKSKTDTRSYNNGSASSIAVGTDKATSKQMKEPRLKSTPMITMKTPTADKILVEKVYGKNGSVKQPVAPISATSYTVASLQAATNSFGQDCLVGEGSLGRVYRAEFKKGKVLAVKKIDSKLVSLQEEGSFLEAVSAMSRLRHPNIISLVGYCVEHGQRLLVYEYIRNGTLHDMLHFSDDSNKTLSWNARVRVALGTARALEYLHEVCLPSMVHRNFKSANILLDEEMSPHLSDCGLAALTPNTERQVAADIVGSFGYSAPEFAMSGIYTVKSDVYSFGVVMLELLTGRKPLDRARSEQSLVSWATPQLHDIDALSKMVDPALNGIYPAKSLSRFADIIAQCIQTEPEFRPPMSEVVQLLMRLVQRASVVRGHSGDELGFPYRLPELDAITTNASF